MNGGRATIIFSVFGRRHTHHLPEIPRKNAEIAYAAPIAFRFAKNTGLDSLAALSASLYRRKNCLVSDVKHLRHYITELMGIKEELKYGGTFVLEHESVMESVQIVTARDGTNEKTSGLCAPNGTICRPFDGGELTRAKFDFTAAHKTVFSVKITKEK